MNTASIAMRAMRTLLLCVVSIFALHACGGGGGPDNTATLVKLEISPASASAPAGTTQQFKATAIFSNGGSLDVTNSTVWTSSDTSVASISSSGLATAKKTGDTNITGTYQGLMGSAPLNVSSAVARSLTVTPINASLPKGTMRQYVATATFSDNTTGDVSDLAAWSSTAPSVASVGNAASNKGMVTAISVGNSNISASFQGTSASTTVTVTAATLSRIEVTPTAASIPKGTSRQYTAMGVYSDNTTQNLTIAATWTTGSAIIASVSNDKATKGLVSGLSKGTTTVNASFSGITGSTGTTVSDASLNAIQITPANGSVANGATLAYTATGTYSDQSTSDITTSVTWASNDESVATISNAGGSQGQATGKMAGGTTKITAASADIVSNQATLNVTAAALSRIDVTPTEPSIPLGSSQQFTATGVYTDATTQDITTAVTWASNTTSVLEISNASGSKGSAVAKELGTATVSASQAGITGSTLATVSDATLTSLAITPANAKLAKGFSQQYTATGTYSDNHTADLTTSVTWASGNTNSATISNADGSRGLVRATLNPGTAIISATLGNKSSTTPLTVTSATLSSVAISPASPSGAKGTTSQLTATGTFSDSTTQNLTSQASWSSADTGKATVSDTAGSKGKVTAVDVGSSTITAAVSNAATNPAVAGTATYTVTAAALQSIAITPAAPSVAKGTSQSFVAMGSYSDGSVKTITNDVTWTSATTSVATISNTAPNNGKATTVGTGSSVITAALSGVSGTATLTVTAAELASIAVTPTTPSVAAGRSQQFAAEGTYTDGSKQTITTNVTWSSDTTSVATISNADGSKGLASTSTKGSSKITATQGTVTSPAVTLTVTDAVPVSIAVTPAAATVAAGGTQQFTATESFSDNSTPSDQTQAVTWSSSDVTVATIDNSAGAKGLVSTIKAGTVTITATDSSVTPNIVGSTTLTVSPATLQSIKVESTGPSSLPANYVVKYKATGNYSDSSTQDITSSVTWQSLAPEIATVDDAAGAKGEVKTVALGSTTIKATLNTVSGTAPITVDSQTLRSIAVTPTGATINGSGTLQMTATATFSGNGTLDITKKNGTVWASSSTMDITVDQNGLATGSNNPIPGSSNISATKGGVSHSVSVSHRAATPTVP